MQGTLQSTESLLPKLRPARPPHSIPIAVSLDVKTVSSSRLQLTLREIAESGEEALQRASRLTAEFLANEREARESLSNELHRNQTCGVCKMDPIIGPCWIGAMGSGFDYALCNNCKMQVPRASAASFTRVCGFVPAAQREALAHPSAPESAPAPPLVLSLPKSLVLEIYVSWERPERGQVAIPLLGWSDLAEFTLQSSPGQPTPPVASEQLADALKDLLQISTAPGEPLSSEQLAKATGVIMQTGGARMQRAALFWKHAPGPGGRQQLQDSSSLAQGAHPFSAPSGLQWHDELVSAARQQISLLQQNMQNLQVEPHGAEIELDDEDDTDL